MKIIVEQICNEEDIYQFPTPTKEKMKKDEIPKAVLTHKKGELKEQRQKVGKYCCSKMKDQEGESIKIHEVYSEFASVEQLGCYISREKEYGEDIDCVHINYCPFCGERIEIEKRKAS